MKTVARVPILVGDHRLSVEIVTPKLDNTLKSERWNTVDSRLTARLYGMFQLGNNSAGASSDDSVKLVKVIARGMEARRHMLKRAIERDILRPLYEQNDDLVTPAKLQFNPRAIALDFDAAYASFLFDLRQSNDLSAAKRSSTSSTSIRTSKRSTASESGPATTRSSKPRSRSPPPTRPCRPTGRQRTRPTCPWTTAAAAAGEEAPRPARARVKHHGVGPDPARLTNHQGDADDSYMPNPPSLKGSSRRMAARLLDEDDDLEAEEEQDDDEDDEDDDEEEVS